MSDCYAKEYRNMPTNTVKGIIRYCKSLISTGSSEDKARRVKMEAAAVKELARRGPEVCLPARNEGAVEQLSG